MSNQDHTAAHITANAVHTQTRILQDMQQMQADQQRQERQAEWERQDRKRRRERLAEAQRDLTQAQAALKSVEDKVAALRARRPVMEQVAIHSEITRQAMRAALLQKLATLGPSVTPQSLDDVLEARLASARHDPQFTAATTEVARKRVDARIAAGRGSAP